MDSKKYILTGLIAEKKLQRMALEIAEQNYNELELILIGIKGSGVVIAKKISAYLQKYFDGKIIDIELCLDKKMPASVTLSDAINFNDKTIILIDDVANSGKTMLYALKPLLQHYPKKIQTLALVERTHKTFPIDVDYVGLSISTTIDEHIYVEVVGNELLGATIELT